MTLKLCCMQYAAMFDGALLYPQKLKLVSLRQDKSLLTPNNYSNNGIYMSAILLREREGGGRSNPYYSFMHSDNDL